MGLGPILVLGAGKVGSALARSWRAEGIAVTLRAARRGLPARRIGASTVVLALRDAALEPAARELAERALMGRGQVALHCAGARDAEILAPLRARGVAVGRIHPLLAFADRRHAPSFGGACAHVAGDPLALRRATAAARALGMRPVMGETTDLSLYHAAAALLANGSAALAAAAGVLLEASGHRDPAERRRMLGPLLHSVAQNLASLGAPALLTGPVRRGDAAALRAHLEVLGGLDPALADLYRALAIAQLPLARALEEAEPADFDAIERLIR